nr:MAG TPA: hypothetical protein [Caudoviricetes sp.]
MGIAQFYTEYEPKKYERTHNFRDNSYASYLEQTGARFYGGIIIGDKKMDSYDEDNVFFNVLYNPTHTWHGTKDLPASFVLYDYMHDFHKNLVADFRRRCTVSE